MKKDNNHSDSNKFFSILNHYQSNLQSANHNLNENISFGERSHIFLNNNLNKTEIMGGQHEFQENKEMKIENNDNDNSSVNIIENIYKDKLLNNENQNGEELYIKKSKSKNNQNEFFVVEKNLLDSLTYKNQNQTPQFKEFEGSIPMIKKREPLQEFSTNNFNIKERMNKKNHNTIKDSKMLILENSSNINNNNLIHNWNHNQKKDITTRHNTIETSSTLNSLNLEVEMKPLKQKSNKKSKSNREEANKISNKKRKNRIHINLNKKNENATINKIKENEEEKEEDEIIEENSVFTLQSKRNKQIDENNIIPYIERIEKLKIPGSDYNQFLQNSEEGLNSYDDYLNQRHFKLQANFLYIDDILRNYYSDERILPFTFGYIEYQTELHPKMRSILIEWLMEVSVKYDFKTETIFLTTFLIDWYLSIEKIPRNKLQAVGISALLISTKFHEILIPELPELVYISDGAYGLNDILFYEKRILIKTSYSLTLPTSMNFFEIFSLKLNFSEKEINYGLFILEAILLEYNIIKCCPSIQAHASILITCIKFKKDINCFNGLFQEMLIEIVECSYLALILLNENHKENNFGIKCFEEKVNSFPCIKDLSIIQKLRKIEVDNNVVSMKALKTKYSTERNNKVSLL